MEPIGFAKPSSTVTYALRALVDVALHQSVGPVTLATVAKRQAIPLRYLEQLFNRLRREGIVVAERGPRGGYRLDGSPSDIRVSRIFQCLKSNGPSPETRPKSARKSEASRSVSDPTDAVWRQVEKAVKTTLEATTLETLIAQARKQTPSDVTHPYTFHI